jgi:hypothetical protein
MLLAASWTRTVVALRCLEAFATGGPARARRDQRHAAWLEPLFGCTTMVPHAACNVASHACGGLAWPVQIPVTAIFPKEVRRRHGTLRMGQAGMEEPAARGRFRLLHFADPGPELRDYPDPVIVLIRSRSNASAQPVLQK